MAHEEELALAYSSGISEGQSKAILTLKSVMTQECEEPRDPLSQELHQLVNLVKRHASVSQQPGSHRMSAALSNIKHNHQDLDDSCLL